jgi:hypothetical protein
MGNSFSRFGKFSAIILLNILLFQQRRGGLYLFSFFNAHDSQVWSFGGVAEFLNIPFIALELFD